MNELGKYLEEERLQRHLTLEEISNRTRLSLKVLRALEEGNYEQIGTPLLIRSFLKNYCGALEVDPEPLIERYGSEIASYGEGILSRHRSAPEDPDSSWKRKRTLLFLVCFVGIAILGGWLLDQYITRRNAQLSTVPQPLVADNSSHEELSSELSRREPPAPKPEPQPEASKHVGQESPAATPTSSMPPPTEMQAGSFGADPNKPGSLDAAGTAGPANEGAAVVAPPQTGKHKLVIVADKNTWVDIRVDGKNVVKGLLKTGEKKEWNADKNADLVLGRSGEVSVEWDGRPVATKTKRGRMTHIILPQAQNANAAQTNANP